MDGPYIPRKKYERRAIPYTHVREADIMWSKRIWRKIDLHQKMNHPLYYPVNEINDRKSLFDVLVMGIEEEWITAYGNAAFDDEFNHPLSKEEAIASLSYAVYINREDEDGELIPDSVRIHITSDEIKEYWIKEDWFFDRQRSKLDVRIIGMAPVREKLDEDGVTVRGVQPLFWVYFPEARHVLANEEVFNRFNNAERLSFDDLFWKRMFSSYVYKESNVYDRTITDYKTGIDALIESEGINNDIFVNEQDLWSY